MNFIEKRIKYERSFKDKISFKVAKTYEGELILKSAKVVSPLV